MQWLNNIVDELIERHPEGEILVESGGSPSGTYHLGHMRELIICDAVLLELHRRGRQAKHVYFVDDLDAFRKVPANVPETHKEYLGIPLCDVPAPEGKGSYADYFLNGLKEANESLGIQVEFIRSHEKYRSGYFVPVIERCLSRVPEIKESLETISNRKLPPEWSPIQIIEDGRLKNRQFLNIDAESKTLTYRNVDHTETTVSYEKGEVKMDWRLDWPGRWWMMGVDVEPFGREHASAGGSYDTGVALMKVVYEDKRPPLPIPYDSVHMVGDNKKMSASKGTALSANDALSVLPAEVIRYFMLKGSLNKPAFFDPVNGVVQLMDEYAALANKADRTDYEERLLFLCSKDIKQKTVSRVPFSLMVASYQSALRDKSSTIDIIARTEYSDVAIEDAEIIKHELEFIDAWLDQHAPEDVKFALTDSVNPEDYSDNEKQYLSTLADQIAAAPSDADGAWFHQTIYSHKETSGLPSKDLFVVLYRVLIGKTSGPRAGWFLSILPRDWLIKRLRLEG